MNRLRLLAVLLCYNDGDLLRDSLSYYLAQNHDLIVWDHGSTDETPRVIEEFRPHLLETRHIPRDFDFYQLYPAMSRHLIDTHIRNYDWISWPDQDEFLEGPTRQQSYFESLEQVHGSACSWIQFNNFNYWFTAGDDAAIVSPVERVRHYALFPDCAPRIRAWRASATNERIFNHNAPLGEPCPQRFNLRHYPMRSEKQMRDRVLRDRAGLYRDGNNYHYENMKQWMEKLHLRSDQLHCDDGRSELDPSPIFNWRTIYGHSLQTAPEKLQTPSL